MNKVNQREHKILKIISSIYMMRQTVNAINCEEYCLPFWLLSFQCCVRPQTPLSRQTGWKGLWLGGLKYVVVVAE